METKSTSHGRKVVRVVARVRPSTDPATKRSILVHKPTGESSETVSISSGAQFSGSKDSYKLDYCYEENDTITHSNQTLKILKTFTMIINPIGLLSITLLLASAVCIQGIQINDTDGNPVTTTDQYFIQPVNNGGDGLFPYPTHVTLCPLRIALLPSVTGPPVSFSFIPPWSQKTIVDTYSDVTIEYKSDYWPVCSDSSKFWKVEASSSNSEDPAILIGGNPTRTNSWFQIRTAGENIYELATRSGTVGTIPAYWYVVPARLVLTNDTAKTLFVKFNKLDVATLATY